MTYSLCNIQVNFVHIDHMFECKDNINIHIKDKHYLIALIIFATEMCKISFNPLILAVGMHRYL